MSGKMSTSQVTEMLRSMGITNIPRMRGQSSDQRTEEAFSLELVDISCRLSQKLTETDPLEVKVTKIIDERTFEMTPSDTPVYPSDFWDDDHDNDILSLSDKQRLHIQYHRSSGAHGKVLAFVMALQELCDSGISLQHRGKPVVDIWVMSTSELDVSDIPEEKMLKVRDPISGVTAPAVNTHENMEKLRKMGRKAVKKFGLDIQASDKFVEHLKKDPLSSYRGSVPHWWVAAIVEGRQFGDAKERYMVHIDICAVAYEESAFRLHDGKWTSLQMFVTPEYILLPSRCLPQDIKTGMLRNQKFIMDAGTRSHGQEWESSGYCMQPFSIRHLRCFHRKDNSYVEVTSLNTFVTRGAPSMAGNLQHWFSIAAELRHSIILRLPAGTPIILCNFEKRPELNGRSGHVHESVTAKPPSDRIPVWVSDIQNPLSVKTTCIRLTERTQYLSHAELVKSADKMKLHFDIDRDSVPVVSDRDEAACQKVFWQDPQASEAFQILTSGKVTISCFSDPNFATGIRRLLKPPCVRLFPEAAITFMNNGLEVAEHPKSTEAFKIMAVIQAGKQRALEEYPSMMAGDGSVLLGKGSNFDLLVLKVANKIKKDQGLTEVFEMMDRYILYPNPVRQMAKIGL